MVTLRIKELSKQRGIALNALAKKVGISATSLSCIIAGKQKPSFDTLEKLSAALDVEVSELFAKSSPHTFVCPKCGAELSVSHG